MKYFLYSKILNAYISLPNFTTTSDFSKAHCFENLADAAEKLYEAKSIHCHDYEIWDSESLAETIKI